MATILRRENIFSLEFELSVGLALFVPHNYSIRISVGLVPIGKRDLFGWR